VAKCATGREGFHPGGADVRVEYVRAKARMSSAWGRDVGVGSERRGLVFSSVAVRDCSSWTRVWTAVRVSISLVLVFPSIVVKVW